MTIRLACLAMEDGFVVEQSNKMYDTPGFFKARALEEIRRAKRYLSFVSLISLDISHINSHHEIENFSNFDQFLAALRNLIRKSVRDTDLVSMANGGKISILLIETPREGAMVLSKRLKRAIKYFLCSNTKSPTNWRVPSKESSFPDSRQDEESLISALGELDT